MSYAKSFYCALVIERHQDGESHCAVVRDKQGNPTDSDTACAAWAAELSGSEENTAAFFTVYRVDGEGLHWAVADFTDRDEARTVCGLLNMGLRVVAVRGPGI